MQAIRDLYIAFMEVREKMNATDDLFEELEKRHFKAALLAVAAWNPDEEELVKAGLKAHVDPPWLLCKEADKPVKGDDANV